VSLDASSGHTTQFHRLHPLSPVLRSGLFVAAWLGWLINNARNGVETAEVVVSGVVAVVAGLGYGIASWWFTRYRVNPEEIRVESGVLRRQSRRIRIERLQAVEVQQPLVARLLGMAELSLEVAGGESGARLAFLPLSRAEELRRQLLERTGVATPAGSPEGQLLFRVDPVRLLASQILRTGFVTALLGAAVGLAASAAGGEAVGVVLVAGAAVGVVAFVFRSFAVLHGFTVRSSPQGLRVRSGLLGVRSQTIPIGRVQGLVLVQPLLWRLLGWVRADVTVAGPRGSGAEEGEQIASRLVPVAPHAEAVVLAARVLGADPTSVVLAEPPARARWVAPLTRPRLRVGLGHGLVVTTRGLLTARTDVVPRAKIQSVNLIQGPLQRSMRLASLRFDLPSGPVAALAAHRDQAEAWELAHSVVTGD